ncbi:MAG: exodeoxyribonuclease VII small subunit [Clostridia bacterium]|nr:exodeoxyribonuclease VII small subunit [Clostridia bacterium]
MSENTATKAKKSAAVKKNIKFEDAVSRLEEVVKSLEGDKVSLDEMLALYEEGVGLVKNCLSQLDAAEQKVQKLSRDESGEIVCVDFDVSEG